VPYITYRIAEMAEGNTLVAFAIFYYYCVKLLIWSNASADL